MIAGGLFVVPETTVGHGWVRRKGVEEKSLFSLFLANGRGTR